MYDTCGVGHKSARVASFPPPDFYLQQASLDPCIGEASSQQCASKRHLAARRLVLEHITPHGLADGAAGKLVPSTFSTISADHNFRYSPLPHHAAGHSRRARLQGLFLLPIPAGLTPLLQPLDLWCFAPYKRLLEDESRKQRMDQGGEPLSVRDLVQMYFPSVCRFLGRPFPSGRLLHRQVCPPVTALILCTVILGRYFPDGRPRCRRAVFVARRIPTTAAEELQSTQNIR